MPTPSVPQNLVFRSFQPGDEVAFRELNEAWISKLFTLEEKDRKVLGDPATYILKPGGHIYVAVRNGETVGCCALLAMEADTFEVSKMAVSEQLRGGGIGRKLLQYVIAEADALGVQRLYLETNSKLSNAIHLYEALGFTHLPPEKVSPLGYARADVYMERLNPRAASANRAL